MDSIALSLVLCAAVFHAGWNRLLHDVPDRLAALMIAGLAAGILLLPAILAGPPRSVLPLLIASALAETAYALFLAASYRHGDLSLSYPIGRGTAPLLVTIGAWLVLQQGLRPQTLLGAAALGVGIILIGFRGRASARSSALLFAMLTGVSIAVYSLVDSQAVRHTSPAGYLGLVLFLEGLILAAVLRPDRQRWRAALRPGIGIAIGSIAAYLLVLLAFQRAAPARVSTLREVSILLSLILARERPTLPVWLGGGLMVAGAFLVTL